MDKISQAHDYYLKNKDILQKDYNNQYIAIKDCKVITSGDSKEQVVKYMLENKHKLGDFLVHLVSDTSDAIHRYYSRIY